MAWTELTRLQYVRTGGRYASDLTDAEWPLIAPFLPAPKPGGRPRTTDLRDVFDAILYSATTGRQWRMLPAALRRSMTCDRGSEMACHPELARRLKIDIWFCDPHAVAARIKREPQRPSALRLIPRIKRLMLEVRQFFPKGTDLSGISQTEPNDVVRLMNQRPRKTLGWKTPEEAMAEELAAVRSTVSLET